MKDFIECDMRMAPNGRTKRSTKTSDRRLAQRLREKAEKERQAKIVAFPAKAAA